MRDRRAPSPGSLGPAWRSWTLGGLVELRLADADLASLDRRVRATDRLTALASEHKVRIEDLVS